MEYAGLRRVLFGPAHFDPVRRIKQPILFLIHKPIDKARPIGLTGHLHQLVQQFPLHVRFILLIYLIDKREAGHILADLLAGQPRDVPISAFECACCAWIIVVVVVVAGVPGVGVLLCEHFIINV